MEKSRNTDFCGGGEDEERQSINGSSANIDRYFQDPVPSIGVQNLLEINQIQTGAETESMRQPEQCQRQPADISSADSHSRRNIPQITAADPRARKKRNDKAYRDRVKEKQKRMKSTVETVEAENELLKRENVLVNQKFEAQLEELDKLKKNYEKQYENEQQMKIDMNTLKDENEYLKKENVSVNQKFEAQSKELDKLKKQYKKQFERKRELKSNLKTVEAENGKLKDAIIESLNASVKRLSESRSIEVDQLRSKLENLEKELGLVKTSGHRQSIVGSSTNLIGGFGQYWPNVESSQAIVIPSSPAFHGGSGTSSPATGSPYRALRSPHF
ncbi:hypothetical protein SLA2020_029400 [Shorea laevis]